MSATLEELEAVILARQAGRPEGSYTARLFAAGEVEIAKKVGEEAIEVIAAFYKEPDARLISESADLLYHWLVLLAARGIALGDVEAELRRRMRS